jgi:hypothetical protein
MIGFIDTSLKLQSIITVHTLNDVCLTNLSEESLEFTKEPPFVTAREPNRDRSLLGFQYCSS